MKLVKNDEVLSEFINFIEKKELSESFDCDVNYLIKEIKIQRQECLNNPTIGNTISLVCWFDTLLHKIEQNKKAA